MSVAKFESWQQFLFQTGLYSPVSADTDKVVELTHEAMRVDGYCRECAREVTFYKNGNPNINLRGIESSGVVFRLTFKCLRDMNHDVEFMCHARTGMLEKVGQIPSLADIVLDESREYRAVLTKDDARELHKAIGLAANGVGIGSFVYLRRIFERLIQSRFNEFCGQEGWIEEEFRSLRMDEKVGFLKGHLPTFLVENRRIYGILSLGIHELTEEECLSFFPVLRASTIMILEEDKIARERRQQQESLKAAIQKFSSPKAAGAAPKKAGVTEEAPADNGAAADWKRAAPE
jgi:hypothetical protein